jgi:hypothetical protein
MKQNYPLMAVALGFALVLAPPSLLAAESAGTVKLARGAVSIERGGEQLPANVGDALLESDKVVTGADGMAGLTLRDNTRISVGPGSVLSLDSFAFDTTTHGGELSAKVHKGSVAVVNGQLAKTSSESVSFSTPLATLGVRGTSFVIEVADSERQ